MNIITKMKTINNISIITYIRIISIRFREILKCSYLYIEVLFFFTQLTYCIAQTFVDAYESFDTVFYESIQATRNPLCAKIPK